MDLLDTPAQFLFVASAFLLLLLCSNRALQVGTTEESKDENGDFQLDRLRQETNVSPLDAQYLTTSALHSFRLWNCIHLLGDDLGYWMKPCSTTWFSRFLLEQYDDDHWVQMFRMTKPSVFALADLLKPSIMKKNTKYRLAIPVLVRVACTLFKLTHGASLLICSEMFAVGRSSVSMLLRDVVQSINVVLRNEISWPRGQTLLDVEADFKNLCGLPGVVGAIDGTHIAISKPKFAPTDYFYFKSGGYSLNCQAVVDSRQRFLDLFLGMPGSTNDSRVLRRSSLYRKVEENTLWDAGILFQGFTPSILGDAGYPLLSWLMVPHHEHRDLSVADTIFNRRQRRGRGVVENAFAMLKQIFRELLVKSDLHVTFLPNIIIACAIIHNMLQRQSDADILRLQNVLQTEGFSEDLQTDVASRAVPIADEAEDIPRETGLVKRQDLGVYLTIQRAMNH